MSIAAAARRRGVRRLVHFTPARNLHRIIRSGAIRPVSELAAEESAAYAITDAQRVDGHPELTCCSVEYPNAYYLHIAKQRADLYPDWIALLLAPELLDMPGTYLSPRNAAAGTAVPASPIAFESMYASAVPGAQGRTFARRSTHLPAVPTDLQAEVLLPGRLPLSQVSGVVVRSKAVADTVRAQLRQLQQPAPEHWRWISCPTTFDRDGLRRSIWNGNAPEETLL